MFRIDAVVLAGILWTDILRGSLVIDFWGNFEGYGLENSSDSVQQF